MRRVEVVQMLDTVWNEIDRLGSSFSDEEWALPTTLPLWTTQDVVAHLAATESLLLGRDHPTHVPPNAGSFPNRIAELNEVGVDYRRSWPPHRVLAEFREVTAARLVVLCGMSEGQFAHASWTPIGRGTYQSFMQTRMYDAWLHTIDLCDATGRQTPLNNRVGEYALKLLWQFLHRSWQRSPILTAGQSVRFEISGPRDASRTYYAKLCRSSHLS